MGQPLEVHIRELQEFYWSSADPDGLGFVQLADALRRAGDLVEARRVLREGLGRHPDYLSGHVVAAWLSQDQGNSQEAEAQFRTSLELDPRNLCALRGLAEILLAREDLGPALEFMEALLQEDPLDLDLPDRISELRSRLGEPQRIDSAPAAEPPPVVWDDPDAVAEELNWEMAALQPDSSPEPVREEAIRAAPEVPGLGEEPSAYPEAGDLGEYSGFLRDEVVEDGEPIPSMDDLDGALVTATLGEVYLRQGWLDRAEGVFLTLLREDPSNELAKRRLLDVRELMGETGIWAVKSKAEETPTPSIVPIASLGSRGGSRSRGPNGTPGGSGPRWIS